MGSGSEGINFPLVDCPNRSTGQVHAVKSPLSRGGNDSSAGHGGDPEGMPTR